MEHELQFQNHAAFPNSIKSRKVKVKKHLYAFYRHWADGGGVGGWYSWQKEPRAAHCFFLFQIKKGTSKLIKMAILRKKGTLGNQWQSLINSRHLIISKHIEQKQ